MIAAYLRESTDKQDIGTQRKLIQDHCDRNHLAFREFADDGFSGTIPFRRRPQAAALWEAAKQGKVEEVVVYRYDRLGRDHADTFSTIGALMKLGVRLLSLKEGPAENTASGRLKVGIQTLFAASERDTIIERSTDASRQMAARGEWMGGIAPYGYRMIQAGEKTRLGLATEEVDILKRIYKDAADGRSCIWIAAALNRRGVPTAYARDRRAVLGAKTSGIWTSTRVRNLITNPIYKGIYIYGKRKNDRDEDGTKHLKVTKPEQWIKALCPDLAIVSEEFWERACSAVHRNQIAAMAHAQYSYLLRGLVRCSCGLCYYGMTSTRQPSGKKVIYYMHSRRSPRKRCTSAALRGEELEAAVWSDIEVFLAKPGAVIRELEEQMEADGSHGRKVKDEIRQLEDNLASQTLKRRRAQDLLIDGTLNRADFDRQTIRIAETVASIEKELLELRSVVAEQDANALALGKARSILEDLREKTEGKLTFEKRRAIVEALASGITVTPKGTQPEIRVTFRFEPHAQRYSRQWERAERLPLNDTDGHRCHKRRRCES